LHNDELAAAVAGGATSFKSASILNTRMPGCRATSPGGYVDRIIGNHSANWLQRA
jgi:hypothetical protein